MTLQTFDFVVLTDARYVNPPIEGRTQYVQNVLTEDALVQQALEDKGFKVYRTNWDNPSFDWSSTKYIIFRTTWDYFERFDEFSSWLSKVEKVTTLINPKDLIYWNIDKHYLLDLKDKGVAIPPTVFLEEDSTETLEDAVLKTGWKEVILKPAISGAGRHTYRFKAEDAKTYESIFTELIENESMMIQEFQANITSKGEIALIFFGEEYSHAILKRAKEGDFRVQDDFGGTVHDYTPDEETISFARKAINACPILPLYARVDIIWDNNDQLVVGELELIEPELWFRNDQNAGKLFAQTIIDKLSLLFDQ